MPDLISWLDCAWLQYNFSTGNASFRVLAGLCLVVVQHSTTLILQMPPLTSWLDCAWLQYNFSTGNASFRVLAGLCLVVVQL